MTISSATMATGSKAGAVLLALTFILWLIFNFRSIYRLLQQSTALLPSGSHHERNIIAGAIFAAMTLSLLSFSGLVSHRWEYAKDHNYNTLEQRHLANHSMIKMLNAKHSQFPEWGALGYGPGAFMPLFPFFTHDKANTLKSRWDYAHNDPLETLIEWGWIGTSLWILLIAGAAFILIYEQSSKRKHHRLSQLFYFNGATLALFVFVIHSTVDFPFQIESIAITFSALLGIAWAAPSLRRQGRQLR